MPGSVLPVGVLMAQRSAVASIERGLVRKEVHEVCRIAWTLKVSTM
jgi:hypothetical protein